MTDERPSELAARMRQVATRTRPGAAAAEATSTPPPQPPQAPTRRPRPARVRFTVDLDRDLHRQLRLLALDMGTDATEIVRTLLAKLFADPALLQELQDELGAGGVR